MESKKISVWNREEGDLGEFLIGDVVNLINKDTML